MRRNLAYAFIPIVVLVLVFGAYVFVQAPVTTRAQTTETTTSSTSTSINTSTLCTSTLSDTISTSTQSSEINIFWSYPSSFDSSSPANFPSAGHSFNYTVGFDGYASTYTIESVFTCTSGFSVTGIFWDGYITPRYNLPQSVYNGTNFPFIISIASSLNNYTSDLNIYVLTSSSCCYFNGTSINS